MLGQAEQSLSSLYVDRDTFVNDIDSEYGLLILFITKRLLVKHTNFDRRASNFEKQRGLTRSCYFNL